MRHIIRFAIALTPFAALADPGHGAPVAHTHFWEVAGWSIVVGAAVLLATRIISALRAKRIR